MPLSQRLETIVCLALDKLIDIERQPCDPKDARRSIAEIQARFPDLSIDLIADRNTYDRSLHFDVLLREPGVRTISIGVFADRGLPWPLHNVRRASEGDVVRVNRTVLRLDEISDYFDFVWEDRGVRDRIIASCLMREAVEKQGIQISDDDLQQGLDSFRLANGLAKAEDLERWMQKKGITQRQLEQMVEGELAGGELRRRIVAGREREDFDRRPGDYARVHAEVFSLADEEAATVLAAQLRDGAIDFLDAAGHADDEIEHRARHAYQLSAELRERLHAGAPGDILGPLPDARGKWQLLRIVRVRPATFDSATRRTIRDRIFQSWLDGERQAASIEWLWGKDS